MQSAQDRTLADAFFIVSCLVVGEGGRQGTVVEHGGRQGAAVEHCATEDPGREVKLMWDELKQLDGILRGEATRPQLLRDGDLHLPVKRLIRLLVVLAVGYGACMGTYSLFRPPAADPAMQSLGILQFMATMIKVPMLFFLSLAVTFPSLYVFNALVGSRLTVIPVLRLLVASLAVNLAVLASLGPIVAFFSATTKSYPFIVLFNVLIFCVSGFLGLLFLIQTLNRMSVRRGLRTTDEVPAVAVPSVGESSGDGPVGDGDELDDVGPLDLTGQHILSANVRTVFASWMVVFALVGAQMGWVLRPFIGDPNQPFALFRERESNFFDAVFRSFIQLFTGGN
ncbi:MAG: hypothetical protein R3E01_27980 [Pirellulaceae bacterium]|nr:hypothetical protein [Planctomycetales bacterium]